MDKFEERKNVLGKIKKGIFIEVVLLREGEGEGSAISTLFTIVLLRIHDGGVEICYFTCELLEGF